MDSSDVAKVYSPYSAEQNSTNWDVYGQKNPTLGQSVVWGSSGASIPEA